MLGGFRTLTKPQRSLMSSRKGLPAIGVWPLRRPSIGQNSLCWICVESTVRHIPQMGEQAAPVGGGEAAARVKPRHERPPAHNRAQRKSDRPSARSCNSERRESRCWISCWFDCGAIGLSYLTVRKFDHRWFAVPDTTYPCLTYSPRGARKRNATPPTRPSASHRRSARDAPSTPSCPAQIRSRCLADRDAGAASCDRGRRSLARPAMSRTCQVAPVR
jgi:hypothetical protein